MSLDEESVTALLRERMKELNCLYRVLELTTQGDEEVGTVFRGIVDILPPSLLHDDVAVARIVVGDNEVCSEGWREPDTVLAAELDAPHDGDGFVEIGYTEARPDAGDGEGPFLAEERDLINGVAVHVSRMLHNRQLTQTISQSERLVAVGELTGGIAHDFNNLLTVILGNADLLQERVQGDPRLAPLVEMMADAARRGADLTRRLLAFARRQALEPRAVDINRLLSGMDSMLRRTLGSHIGIESVRGGGLWPAFIDAPQLESAILNLCINARDAMQRGGKLTIETANARLDREYASRFVDVTPGQYVTLTVTDTGEGIPPEHLDRVFEPFFTTKHKGEGTGLGLSMVYGFVKQSQGHIRIYSEPGQGTSVRIYLPRHHGAVEDPAEPREAGDLEQGTEVILLVEDDDLVREFARRQLMDLGYRVHAAGGGDRALEILESGTPVDLLFTDVVMPGVSGRELAARAVALQPGLKVLYTSGYTENAIVHHGRLDEGVVLLGKPYRREDLARYVREALDG